MLKLTDLKSLLIRQTANLLDAENQQRDMLPSIIEKISEHQLKDVISAHLNRIPEKTKNIHEVFRLLDERKRAVPCAIMRGLIRDAEGIIENSADIKVMDAGLTVCFQQMRHYEIAAYGAACSYAITLGYDDAAGQLHKNLEEEKKTDKALSKVAEDTVNLKAKQPAIV